MNITNSVILTDTVLVCGITIETRLAVLTAKTHSVEKTPETLSCGAITATWIIRVDVSVTNTGLTLASWQSWASVIIVFA
jgi:hypothetical protein